MSIEIVFETHSLSEDNERGIATGWLPGRLSARGRDNAADMGRRRRDDGIGAVFTSDLRRAAETAEIAFGDTDIPILYDWRLRECDFGLRNGTPTVELSQDREDYLDRPAGRGGPVWVGELLGLVCRRGLRPEQQARRGACRGGRPQAGGGRPDQRSARTATVAGTEWPLLQHGPSMRAVGLSRFEAATQEPRQLLCVTSAGAGDGGPAGQSEQVIHCELGPDGAGVSCPAEQTLGSRSHRLMPAIEQLAAAIVRAFGG
jgi:hypothetical protein